MSVTASDSIIGFQTRYPEVFRANPVRRYAPLAVLVSIIVYSAYCFWFFSIPKQFERASWGIAGNYLADWISYEARPDVEFEGKLLRISFPRFGIYPEGFIPDWIDADLRSVTREVSKNDIGQTGLAQKSAGGFIAQGQPGNCRRVRHLLPRLRIRRALGYRARQVAKHQVNRLQARAIRKIVSPLAGVPFNGVREDVNARVRRGLARQVQREGGVH